MQLGTIYCILTAITHFSENNWSKDNLVGNQSSRSKEKLLYMIKVIADGSTYHSRTGRLLELEGSYATVPKYWGASLPFAVSGCLAVVPVPIACIECPDLLTTPHAYDHGLCNMKASKNASLAAGVCTAVSAAAGKEAPVVCNFMLIASII